MPEKKHLINHKVYVSVESYPVEKKSLLFLCVMWERLSVCALNSMLNLVMVFVFWISKWSLKYFYFCFASNFLFFSNLIR